MERTGEKCRLMVGEHERNLQWEEGWRDMRTGEEVDEVWGQRWLPVCLWNTSRLALTIKSMQEN